MTRSTMITLCDDLQVGRIGYGAMRLTGPELWGDYPDREAAMRLLREAVDAGVTLIDSADVYGPHTNEVLIREALHPYPNRLVIATKGGLVRGGPNLSSISAVGNPSYLRQSVVLSARRLGVEAIDLYYLHSGYAQDASFADQVGALAELRSLGLIRNVGLSNVTVDQVRMAREIVPIAAVTAHFSVADQSQQSLVSEAIAGGSVFVPWQPVSLARPGIETDPHGSADLRRVLEPIAARHGATIPQVSLAWLLAKSPRMLPIPATTDIAHVRQNLAAVDVSLSPEDVTALDAIARN